MRKQPPDLLFRIADERFVEDAVHAARQHRIEMCHKFHVIGIGAAEFVETVGEERAHFEIGAEVRPAAAERMTPHIDDSRVRKDQADQAKVKEIVRVLVDEERQARRRRNLVLSR